MLNKFLKLKYNFSPILHNRIILYLFFVIALIDLLYFLNNKDMYSFSALVLIGILTSFFSKNMTVILFFSVVFTHILKYGRSSFSEGLDSMESDTKVDLDDVKNTDTDKVVGNLSTGMKDFSKRVDNIIKTKDTTRNELVNSLPEIKETREKIIESVQNMQPLLDKFQGFVDKFNEYKKTSKNELTEEQINSIN